jgi:alanine racemase
VACVIKSNAYGLGISRIANILETAGCINYFVANLKEGTQLRKLIKNKNAKVYVFSGSGPNEEAAFIQHRLIPIINSSSQLKRWYESVHTNRNYPIAIHLDTGMQRLGFDGAEFRDSVQSLKLDSANIDLVMTHLVSSEKPNAKMNIKQLDEFKVLASLLPNAKKSIANSHGVALGKDFYLDMVRPGISLYIPVSLNKKIVTQNSLALKSPILQVRKVRRVSTVGYGATEKVAKGNILATIGCGYADGYLRNLSSKGYGWLGGSMVKVVGRVSMDLTVFDISTVDSSYHQLGQPIELFGDHQPISQLAMSAGTISYEIITNLGTRWKRVYV